MQQSDIQHAHQSSVIIIARRAIAHTQKSSLSVNQAIPADQPAQNQTCPFPGTPGDDKVPSAVASTIAPIAQLFCFIDLIYQYEAGVSLPECVIIMRLPFPGIGLGTAI